MKKQCNFKIEEEKERIESEKLSRVCFYLWKTSVAWGSDKSRVLLLTDIKPNEWTNIKKSWEPKENLYKQKQASVKQNVHLCSPCGAELLLLELEYIKKQTMMTSAKVCSWDSFPCKEEA